MKDDKLSLYMSEIARRLENNFEIEYDATENGEPFEMIGRYHNISGRIFITPKDIIDKYETFERCYIRHFDTGNEVTASAYFETICRFAESLNPDKDHFYTDMTGVMLCDKTSDDLAKALHRLTYSRSFRFLLRGFTTVRIVCVNMTNSEVYTNKAGKQVRNVYRIQNSI